MMRAVDPCHMLRRAAVVTVPAAATTVTRPPVVIFEIEPSELIETKTPPEEKGTPQREAIPCAIVAMEAPGPFRIWIAPFPMGSAFSHQESSESSMLARASVRLSVFHWRNWYVFAFCVRAWRLRRFPPGWRPGRLPAIGAAHLLRQNPPAKEPGFGPPADR